MNFWVCSLIYIFKKGLRRHLQIFFCTFPGNIIFRGLIFWLFKKLTNLIYDCRLKTYMKKSKVDHCNKICDVLPKSECPALSSVCTQLLFFWCFYLLFSSFLLHTSIYNREKKYLNKKSLHSRNLFSSQKSDNLLLQEAMKSFVLPLNFVLFQHKY